MTSLRTIQAAALGCAMALVAGIAEARDARTFAHLFEWSWNDIAHECSAFLGPKGFAAVQISLPNEHIQGEAWSTRYQPVSYGIHSRSGDDAAFRQMVETSHAAGVKIYADAVINHTADQVPGPGVGGTTYRRKNHPSIPFSSEHYHGDCDIAQGDTVLSAYRLGSQMRFQTHV